MSLSLGSLFSGGGGLDIGLEQAGLKTVWQVEYDDWAREQLGYIFPDTEKFKDVRDVGKHNLRPVDVICGGFPCQDISIANINGKGLDGERSGLWSEYKRIIRELRPKYALIENVANITVRGLERLLCDLAEIGYDAEWQPIRASAFGLPTRRKRVFIVTYPKSDRPFSFQVFARDNLQSMYTHPRIFQYGTPLHFKDLQYAFPQIPEHLRMDNGISYELSEIGNAIRVYGNSVAPPVAKFLGGLILNHWEKVNA